MLHKHSRPLRLLTAGLAIAAIAPASAAAQPTDAHAVAAGGGTAVTSQNLTAPDQVDRGSAPQPAGQAVAAGGGPGVTPQTLTAPNRADRGGVPQNLASPDQVDRVNPTPPAASSAPQWPTNPTPLPQVKHITTATPADDGGLDTGIWIALGGAALLAAMGLGLVGRKRLRPRQLA
jgi:hypothetical protein